MKVAVVTCLPAKWDVDVNARHECKHRHYGHRAYLSRIHSSEGRHVRTTYIFQRLWSSNRRYSLFERVLSILGYCPGGFLSPDFLS